MPVLEQVEIIDQTWNISTMSMFLITI